MAETSTIRKNMNQLKIHVKHAFAEGFVQMVDSIMKQHPVESDDDRLVIAGLTELRNRFHLRIEKMQRDYTLTLTPVQALALRIFYTDYVQTPTTYMGSVLFNISNDVAQLYIS